MAKKKPDYKVDSTNILATIKANTRKNGKIRGKNKKQTRILKGACCHHLPNNKGKIKPTISNDGKMTCTCRVCGASFKGKPYSKQDVENKMKGMVELDNQLKYLAVAVNAGGDMVRYSSELGSMLACFPKYYRNVVSIAEKAENVRKKKKKKRGSDYSNVGSWS